jgi:transcriptional regulator with XRE-family HTH domain
MTIRNKRVQRFGEKLRTLRKQRGMTIKELAPLTGYSTHSHISEIENGRGRWRKLKGTALVRLSNDRICQAEIHWYEAHGIGKKKLKIKRFLE